MKYSSGSISKKWRCMALEGLRCVFTKSSNKLINLTYLIDEIIIYGYLSASKAYTIYVNLVFKFYCA